VGVETISLASDSLGADLIPTDELADCARTALERDGRTILSYGSAAGYTPLRALIAQWFEVHPARVVLTNGSLHGLALLARRLAAHKNVVAEYPIYNRAERVLLAAQAALLGNPVDEEGGNPDEIHNMLVQYSTPAFIYTIPNFHNPTGWTMTYARRRRLVDLVGGQSMVQVQGMQILEDDSYGLTRFEGEAEPAVFDVSGKRTLYLSSFSTTISPGLRVGWLVLPETLADEITADAGDTYITPALLGQATVFEFITRGSFETHIAELRAALKLRRDTMLAAIEKHIPGATASRPEGGYFVWLSLPGMPDGREVLARAEGVTALAGTSFSAMSSFLRLSYCAAAPDEIEAGIERIAAAL
jgi:DNA-binding transcriptional MocR family regulator